jgi:uncharacterized protein YbbC (DUF1343 family)
MGLTIGELGRPFNDEYGIGADFEVVEMDGWRRGMYFDATDRTWIMSSPNAAVRVRARQSTDRRARGLAGVT